MTFRTAAVVTAIVTFVLGVGYLLAGSLLLARWQIEPTESVLLLGRRIGALYVGLSVIFFLGRFAAPSVARSALCSGTVVACSLLALLGIHALSTGQAGSGILVSAAVELLIAAAFIRVLVGDRSAGPAA